MNHITILSIILVLSGVFGGVVSFFSTKGNEEPINNNKELLKSIIIGVAASLLVPLFLNTISSNLIIESETNSYKFFIIIGFCLLASISSKAFIQIMTNKMIKELNEVKDNLNTMKKEVNVIISNETENENEIEEIEVIKINNELMNGKDDERYKILKAFSESRYIYRSLGGLSKETGISKENVQMILNILINHELVEQAKRPKGVRFLITQKGRQIIFN